MSDRRGSQVVRQRFAKPSYASSNLVLASNPESSLSGFFYLLQYILLLFEQGALSGTSELFQIKKLSERLCNSEFLSCNLRRTFRGFLRELRSLCGFRAHRIHL